jgi:hypothetical protein
MSTKYFLDKYFTVLFLNLHVLAPICTNTSLSDKNGRIWRFSLVEMPHNWCLRPRCWTVRQCKVKNEEVRRWAAQCDCYSLCCTLQSPVKTVIIISSGLSDPVPVPDPGKGVCADPVNGGAILGKGGPDPQDRNKERQLSPDKRREKTW